jgi:misacylated tRNA(Ala) deacylase
MTEQLYRTDAYLRECEANVLDVNERGGIVLDRTPFYASAGGQPGDRGMIRFAGRECPIATTVYDTADKSRIVHVAAENSPRPAPGEKVTAVVDWEVRHRHMRMHTALHLLCSLVPFPVTGGQIGAEEGRLDFDIEDASAVDKDRLSSDLNALVAADHPVTERWITDAELEANPALVRTMSVKPPMGAGRVRLVLIGNNGEIDMQDRHIATLDNKAVFVDNAEKGGYGFFETVPASMNVQAIALNLTHKDPIKREIYQNKDFRIGLSHAINRQEIIDTIYVGQGQPWQLAPRPTSPFYNERLAKQYTEYNVDLANEYLDKAGYTERDAQGFRLGPDGKRIVIQVDVQAISQNWIDTLELIKGYWAAVGIQMEPNVMDRSLMYTRKDSNEQDATTRFSGKGLAGFIQKPFRMQTLLERVARAIQGEVN